MLLINTKTHPEMKNNDQPTSKVGCENGTGPGVHPLLVVLCYTGSVKQVSCVMDGMPYQICIHLSGIMQNCGHPK